MVCSQLITSAEELQVSRACKWYSCRAKMSQYKNENYKAKKLVCIYLTALMYICITYIVIFLMATKYISYLRIHTYV